MTNQRKIKVLLATVTAEMPRYYEYYDSIDRLILPIGTDKCQIHSSSPAKNRNIVIQTALKEDCYSHIFFTDDDHVFPSDTLMRLLSHDVDIVSGIYTMKFAPFPVIAFDKQESVGTSKFLDMRTVKPYELKEVVAVGAGCLLIKMDVFKKVTPPWFTLGQIWKDGWGDDLWFCKIAREAGFKIYIDSATRCGHITKCIVVPYWNKEEERWEVGYKINEGISTEAVSANIGFDHLGESEKSSSTPSKDTESC